jgi:hypothetical protein
VCAYLIRLITSFTSKSSTTSPSANQITRPKHPRQIFAMTKIWDVKLAKEIRETFEEMWSEAIPVGSGMSGEGVGSAIVMIKLALW